jgi:hypothetical protein
MSGDPIQALVDRAKQELQAVNQQIEASRGTLRSLEDTLKTTQKQVTDAQKVAMGCNTRTAEAEAKAKGIVDAANREAQVARETAARETQQARLQAEQEIETKRQAAARAAEEAEVRASEAEGRHRALQAAVSVAQQKLDAIKRQASVFAQS